MAHTGIIAGRIYLSIDVCRFAFWYTYSSIGMYLFQCRIQNIANSIFLTFM